MTTHERWLRPPRSPTIVGSAVETIVWSSAARNMPSISAAKTVVSARPARGASLAGSRVARARTVRRPCADPSRNRRVASGIGYHSRMTGIAGEQAGQRSHARRNHELLVAAAREVFARARRRGVARGDRAARRRRCRHAVPPLRHARCTRRGGLRAAHRRIRRARRGGGGRARRLAAFVGLLERMLELQAGDRLLKDVFMRSPPPAPGAASGARGAAPAVRAGPRARPSGGRAARRLRLPRPRAAALVVRAGDRRHGRGRAERLAPPPALAARRAARRGRDAAGRAAAHRRASSRRR